MTPFISFPLGRADASDPTLSNLTLVFLSLIVLGTAAFLAFLIIRAARIRRPRQAEVFAAGAVLWVVITAGTSIYDIANQLKWSKESVARIESGYYDPADAGSDAPRHPWAIYAVAAAGYGLLWFAVITRGILTTPKADPVEPEPHAKKPSKPGEKK